MSHLPLDWKSLEFTCVHEADHLPLSDAQADEWFQKSNALFKAGVDRGDTNQLSASFDLMLKAAERGHVKAMNNLVLAYLGGDGVRQSDSKAVYWAEELIKRDVGMGYYHMGTFLQQGTGVQQDRVAALTYFRKAADLGNAQGQLVTGDKLLEAVSRTSDREKGFSIGTTMLQCALDQGLGDAGYKLGFHYDVAEARFEKALTSFQASAKLGHDQSLYELWTVFAGESKLGRHKDEARAACYRQLLDQSENDRSRKFPNIDRICPLPPKPMPSGR